MTDVLETLGRAISCHQADNLDEAERLYREILRGHPDHADATHLLGVVLFQRGDYERAEDFVRKAIAIDPKFAMYHANLGRIRMAAGQAGDAIPAYRDAIELDPDNAAQHSDLAAAQVTHGDYDAARARARLALELDPDLAQAHLNLGLAIRGIGGAAAREAKGCFQRAIALAPHMADAHQALGEELQSQGDDDAAMECYRMAIRAQPGMVEAHCNLGNILRDRQDLDAALVQYDAALETDDGVAAVHANRAVALHEKGRFQDALEAYGRAIELAPEDPEVHRNRAMTLLLMGRFSDAWPEYEWRLGTARFARERRTWKQPRWSLDAVSASDRCTVLIHAEQGLGDTVQFVRYATLVHERGFHVTLECQPELVRLLQPMDSLTQVIARGETLPSFDFQVPLMSLPGAFATDLSSLPSDVPYLSAPQEDREAWHRHLDDLQTPRIGLCWKGSAAHPRDQVRSPGLAPLLPILEMSGAAFVSLQKEGGSKDIETLNAQEKIYDPTSRLDDFAATAGLLANLDLIITCDTAVGHLAGALGRPVIMVLPQVAEWRWLMGRDDTPWYPSMRLIRQSVAGDWDGVVVELETYLKRHWL